MILSNMEEIIKKLTDCLGASRIKTDEISLQIYGRDWTVAYGVNPAAVVFPCSVEEVQAIVKLANQLNFKLVPSGGRTGLSGGAIASHQEVVVNFEAMNKILHFNPVDQIAICQAGVVTEQLQTFAEEKDLFYPVDIASRGSCQLGGNIATNAGGIKVMRYGLTRQWIMGLKVVTGSGEILDLNKGLIKNAIAYDLRHLFIGSEGTLGFIVEAYIKLSLLPGASAVLLLGLETMENLMPVLSSFQRVMTVNAFEFFSDQALAHVLNAGHGRQPLAEKAKFYALVEFDEQWLETVMDIFQDCLEQGWITDGVVSQSIVQATELWTLREYISESIARYSPYKNDISVVPSNIPKFLLAIDELVAEHYPDFDIIWFGHIGDGNVHLNILKPDAMEKKQFFSKCHQVSEWIFDIVEQFDGSISAEHGVGLLKKDYLHYSLSKAEINYMKAIKKIFDPNGVMNPGKVFD